MTGMRGLTVAAMVWVLSQQGAIAAPPAANPRRARELGEAKSANTRALESRSQGMLDEALGMAQSALAVRRKWLRPEDTLIAESLNTLGLVHCSRNEFDEAHANYSAALAILRTGLGEVHPQVAVTLGNRGRLQQARGNLADARADLEASLATFRAVARKTSNADNRRNVSYALLNLAELLRELGNLDDAQTLVDESLEIVRKIRGNDHPETARALVNAGELRMQRDDFTGARRLLDEAVAIHSRRPIEARLTADAAQASANRGRVEFAAGDYRAALPFLRTALTMRRKLHGASHMLTAEATNDVAMTEYALGKLEQAESGLRSALSILQERVGPEHPRSAKAADNLAMVLATRGELSEAVAVLAKARQTVRRHEAQVIASLAESEQLSYLRKYDRRMLDRALSLALVQTDNHDLASVTAEWLLNGKGIAAEILTARQVALRHVRASVDPATIDEWLTVRARLAGLTLAGAGGADGQSMRSELETLTAREAALSRKLGQAVAAGRGGDPWITLDAVRSAIPTDSVLIEIARIAVFDFQATDQAAIWQPPRYVAWVIPAAGVADVRVIDLGSAQIIDDAIQATRRGMRDSFSMLPQRGEIEAEQAIRGPLGTLGRLVFQPLIQASGGKARWIVSPDDHLSLTPWGALPLNDEQYAIERFEFQLVTTGRQLVESPLTADRTSQGGLIVGAPDFNARLANGAPANALRKSNAASLLPTAFGRLIGAEQEVHAVTPIIERLLGIAPHVLTFGQATERAVRLIESPRLALFSTHAFALDGAEARRQVENPLLRVGLVLAGANRRQAAQRADMDDGILTGLEIAGLNLTRTELVVLSACDTSVGDAQTGEGMAGLHQAFQMAGARTVVSTLWSIPDRETPKVMQAFFESLAEGAAAPAALRQAQLKVMESRRQRDGAAHPLFWAAFQAAGH